MSKNRDALTNALLRISLGYMVLSDGRNLSAKYIAIARLCRGGVELWGCKGVGG